MVEQARILIRALAVFGALVAAGCADTAEPPKPGSTAPSTALSIAAASDLRYALDEIVTAFRERHPEIGVAVTYGSSGNFYAQILSGAPFDLYLSADMTYARQLAEKGVAVADTLFTYAYGHIVLWVPKESTIDERKGLQVLTQASTTRIAIANPELAPYGRAADAALRSSGIYDLVKPKLVLGDNVSQTLQFVSSGSAQAGIIALSLALAPPVIATGRYLQIPGDSHPPIEQGGIVMQAAAQPDAARAFRAFMMTATGRSVLERYGFEVPEP